MSWSWHSFLPLRNVIDRRTAPINDDYLLVFHESAAKIDFRQISTGYTDFTARQCCVQTSPLRDPASEEQQILACTFIAAHERAHARWTDYHAIDFARRDAQGEIRVGTRGGWYTDTMLHQVWNILEDERIERLLTREFLYLSPYLVKGSALMLSLIDKVTASEHPTEVLRWVLRRRVFTRAGMTEPCPLAPDNVRRLEKIEPLLAEAFECSSSRRVVDIARDILKVLEIDSPNGLGSIATVLSGQAGDRGEDDHAEVLGVTAGDAATDLSEALSRGGSGTGTESLMAEAKYVPYTKSKRSDVPRAPYEAIRQQVLPLVAPLARALQPPRERRGAEFERSGTRVSIRAARRTPDTPFRVSDRLTRRRPIAMSLVLDESGSMVGRQAMEAKKMAMLCAETLVGRDSVRIVLAPSGRVVFEQTLGEVGKAMIAGYESAKGTAFAPVVKEELAKLQVNHHDCMRHLILLADGLSGAADLDSIRQLVQRSREANVCITGIGIQLNAAGRKFFSEAFRGHFINVSDADELPKEMQRLLQRMIHRSKR